MMAEPPLLAGADQPRMTWLLPPATESPVGIPGSVAGVTGAGDGADVGVTVPGMAEVGVTTGIDCAGVVEGGVATPGGAPTAAAVVVGVEPTTVVVVVAATSPGTGTAAGTFVPGVLP